MLNIIVLSDEYLANMFSLYVCYILAQLFSLVFKSL